VCERSAWAGQIAVVETADARSGGHLEGDGTFNVGTVDVVADGTGLSSRGGTALLALIAGRLGLVDGLCAALGGTRKRHSAHEPGRVFCDLAVMAADCGKCVPGHASALAPAPGA